MKERDIRDQGAFDRYLDLVREDIATYFPDPAKFLPVPCPACLGKDHAREFSKAGFCYVSCRECGTLFANPRPAADRLREFCVAAPSSRYWIEDFFQPVAEARRQKIFRPRAQYVARRLETCRRGVVGDVGAGFGLFLYELRTEWPDASLTAIEPSPEMARLCRDKGLAVVEAAVEDLRGYDGRFDLLTAFELLEHLCDPRLLIEKAFHLLKAGGYFLATTLSGQGFDIQILWERSKSVFPPHHLNFFTPSALARLCEDVGFVVEELCTPGELDWDIVEGAVLKEGVEVGRFWSWLAMHSDAGCKRDLQTWISRNGLSSHMRVLVRKP